MEEERMEEFKKTVSEADTVFLSSGPSQKEREVFQDLRSALLKEIESLREQDETEHIMPKRKDDKGELRRGGDDIFVCEECEPLVSRKRVVNLSHLDDSTHAEEEHVSLAWRDICATIPNSQSNIAKIKTKIKSKFSKRQPTNQSVGATKTGADVESTSTQHPLAQAGHAKDEKPILRDIHGTCNAGEVVALMGASGAGKSTLMNVLLQRNLGKLNISGKIYVNGYLQPLNPQQSIIKNVSAYVQQSDLFIGTLTVKEHLTFHAMLRMPGSVSSSDRRKRVETVIRELNLNSCQSTMIGVAGRSKTISGGEAKRLSFASEILLNPALLFCDEPTSGLDSFMAENIVQTLKSLAQKGKTILCTIHQPSSEVFNLFDKVMLLSEGRTAFAGSLDQCRNFFAEAGHGCPPNFNPADHYIHQLAIRPEMAAECRKRAAAVCDRFNNSEQQRAILRQIDADVAKAERTREAGIGLSIRRQKKYRAGWLRQFRWLLWRSWLTNVRDKAVTHVRIFQSVVIGLFVGLLYFRTGDDLGVPAAMQNINGVLFFTISQATFTNIFAVINTFPQELHVFMRDSQNMVYRSTPYFISKSLADLPIFTALAVLFASIVYWMCGLRFDGDISYYLIYLVIYVLLTHTCISFGYFLACATGDVNMAMAIAAPIIVPFMLFGGLFINQGDIPVWFSWMQWVSWFRYANEIFVVNQYDGLKSIGCTSPSKNCTGDHVISMLAYDKAYFFRDIICLVALFVAFRCLALLSVIVRARSTH